MIELKKLDTEKRNERAMYIDEMSTLNMLTVINEEDHRVAEAVSRCCLRLRGWWTRSMRSCAAPANNPLPVLSDMGL